MLISEFWARFWCKRICLSSVRINIRFNQKKLLNLPQKRVFPRYWWFFVVYIQSWFLQTFQYVVKGKKNVLISWFWYFLSCFCPIAINHIGLINFGVYHTELSKSRWQVTDAKEYVLLLLESIFDVTRKSCSICFKNAFSLVIDDFFVVYIQSWSLQTFQYVVKGKKMCSSLETDIFCLLSVLFL